MTAALLAPGPSLLATFDDDFAGPRCGVNRACLAFRCEIWAALDLPLILNVSPGVSACELLTNANTLASLQRRQHLRAAGRTVTVESLSCPVPQWSGYSATAALVLLAERGTKQISVFGADMLGTLDYDGVAAGENRGPERWAAEREIWNRVVKWLAGRGIRVERINLASHDRSVQCNGTGHRFSELP